MKSLHSLILGLALSCCLPAAQAQEAITAYPQLQAACDSNPDKCAEVRAKAEAMCAKDPAACEARKAQFAERAAKLQEKCAANPEQCAERKAKMQERAANLKAKCAADPAACEQKKANIQERIQKRQERRNSVE